jgi:hypothetical protein
MRQMRSRLCKYEDVPAGTYFRLDRDELDEFDPITRRQLEVPYIRVNHLYCIPDHGYKRQGFESGTKVWAGVSIERKPIQPKTTRERRVLLMLQALAAGFNDDLFSLTQLQGTLGGRRPFVFSRSFDATLVTLLSRGFVAVTPVDYRGKTEGRDHLHLTGQGALLALRQGYKIGRY